MSRLRRTIGKRKGGFGFNARTEKFESVDNARVIDPAKVVRIALENAVQSGIAADNHRGGGRRKPRKRVPMPAMPPGGSMGGMEE